MLKKPQIFEFEVFFIQKHSYLCATELQGALWMLSSRGVVHDEKLFEKLILIKNNVFFCQ